MEAKDVIESGNRVRLIKFGATWCKPCDRVVPLVHDLCKTLHPDIHFLSVDIDEDSEAFMILKSKRIVSGIPAIVLYPAGVTNLYNPSFVVCGSDMDGIRSIFVEAEQLNAF